MKKTALLMTLAAAAWAAEPPFVLNGDAAKGKEKFKIFCTACHGETGKGDGAAAQALNPAPANFTDPANASRLTDEWVYKMVKEGGAANGKSALMMSWKNTLKEQDVQDVAAYVRSLVPTVPAQLKPGKKLKR